MNMWLCVRTSLCTYVEPPVRWVKFEWGKWGEVGCVGEAGKLSIQLKISTYVGISTSKSGRKNCLNPKYPSVLKITARAL